MNLLIEAFLKTQKANEYIETIKAKQGPIILSGLTGVAKANIIAATKQAMGKPICVITYNELQAKQLKQDIEHFLPNSHIHYFPKKEIASYDYIAESNELAFERMEILNSIYEEKSHIVITTIEAVMQKMIAKETLYKNVCKFRVGMHVDLEKLKSTLVAMGYERNELIENKGEFSVRGGIVDIATGENAGVRIEFWGEEIDSIRTISISSQRSIQMLKETVIYPAHEFLLEIPLEEVIQKIESVYPEQKEDIALLQSGSYRTKIEKYFPFFYTKQVNFLEYLNKEYIVLVDEMDKIEQRKDNIRIEIKNLMQTLTEKERFIPKAIELMYDYTMQIPFLENTLVYLQTPDLLNSKTRGNCVFAFHYREVNFYKSEVEMLLKELAEARQNKKKIVLLGGKEESTKKIATLLQENEFVYQYVKDTYVTPTPGMILLLEGALSAGFEWIDENILVITTGELFAKDKKRRKTSSAFKQGEKVVYADLKIGDYVVHKHHGIGIFIGVNTITSDHVTKDYIKIKYKNEDILYIPTNALDSIRKYVGGGETAPKINKLGSKEWENTKTKVKRNLQEVAKELIELYAKRQKVKGYAFSPDTPWQKQFEDSFPYVETEDQLRCIEETKRDMEAAKPMDRLLCGDVGYGKTEVAIRAAFKAVVDQKQVAYLVPTTVLANQQYESFKARMEAFPIHVELLNRFRTQKEQEDVIRRLQLGEVDVVIGTHRLLSKDVEFKDLGLLIIDEEHRFGVKDKEKIKQLKANIDVLTMTATPIPRTLHMSIMGVRDMSVIYEPPHNRKPVQTYVIEYDEEIIREAITKELERDGQVIYLFNHVEKIEQKVAQIGELVPEAKVDYAHGKMTGKQLEEKMEAFIHKEVNVLVCTTILETGMDIPNANTIIVENADRLGLAQLYQIRGRVGRSDKQAYAYIMYKRDKLLSEVADKRLKAIKEFTEFGSGFKIAMRDLEIRGAGSLLGEFQHGHLEQVGYDTYCNLLDEVVKQMQGVKVEEEEEIQIDMNVSSYIPDTYIENSSQKIEIYQNIALCRTEEDIQNVIDEVIDRYGPMPKEVENLLEIARIKEWCKKAGVTKIAQKPQAIVLYIDEKKCHMENMNILIQTYGNLLRFSPGANPYITLKVKAENEQTVLKQTKVFLEIFSKV